MSGKNIEIKIAATGAQQAAGEIGKVSDATASLGDAASEMKRLEGAIRDTQAAVDKLAGNDYSPENQKLFRERQEELMELKIRYLEVAEAAEEANRAQEKVARKSNIAGAALIGAGIGGAALAKSLAEIRRGFESLDTAKLREIDAAMADQVKTAKGWVEVFTDPMNGIQRLISGTTVAEAFADVNDQIARNAQMQAEAMDRIIDAGRRTAEELKAVSEDIARANAIIAAKEDADAAERDVQDAERIRKGEAPEDVRIDRAAYNRDRELERINRGLEPKQAQVQGLFDDAQVAAGNVERTKADPRADREAIAKAIKQAEEAREKFEQAKAEYDAAKEIAIEQRRGVRAGFEGTVAEASSGKSTRLEREKEAAQRRAEIEARKQQRRELESRLESGKTGLDDRAADASREFGRAAGHSRIAGTDLSGTLGEISKKLSDGTNEKELRQVAAQFKQATEGMGGAQVAALQEMMAAVQAQNKELEIIRSQIKNLRSR